MTIPTSTSLSLRALLKAAADRVGLDPETEIVTGLTGAAKAFVIAAATRSDDLIVVVVPSDVEVDVMTADLRFFLASLEGLSATDADRRVLPFPSLEVDPYRALPPHFEVASARALVLRSLVADRVRIVVGSAPALLPRMSPPERLIDASADIEPGEDMSPTGLGDLLQLAGFIREDPVDTHGEFCVRGGVVDFFPAEDDQPVRIEFIGDTVESVRRYDPATQRSIEAADRITVIPVRERFDEPDLDVMPTPGATVFEYFIHRRHPTFIVSEPDETAAHLAAAFEQVQASHATASTTRDVPPPEALIIDRAYLERQLAPARRLAELDVDQLPPGGPMPDRRPRVRHVSCQPAIEFKGRLADWTADIRRGRERGETVLVVATTPGTAERAVELLTEYDVSAAPVDEADGSRPATVRVAVGHLSRGFRLPDAGLVLYAETDVFDETRRGHERKRSLTRTFLTDFRDLKVGDFVVHVDHGIGVFVGLRQLDIGLDTQEFMELRYADDAKLFVPVEHLDLIQKYTGGARPSLDRLGGTTWERAKTRVKRAMRDMAEELLQLYAARKAMTGHAFNADTHWQREFEEAFEFDLTPDQQTAIGDIKRDMEIAAPMDRLLCGDVGYGKTEVAMGAAFKAVMDGKQVALLAPTTVLAFQHLRTLSDRFAAFPVRVDMLSRFKSKADQKQIVSDVGHGKVDIVVGTHRLLSKDVQFRDLGLLIVDEEQRFGVAHKERIKQFRRQVDVLTLTATPIPRTLNMSLVGIRDMSVIDTPPKDRLAIQTHVLKFEAQEVARAIRNEIERGGQVYFVHNRIDSIYAIADLVTRLVPEARVAVAHGQMTEAALERCMVNFVGHAFDVLVTTTIIENGLDIPNANTLIVNHADQFGLAQLYQLRGRIGRSDRRAYAYLLVPPDEVLSPVARKRLAAILEFSDLGSGFRVAALDLEIRGAGNLLGGEQSGQIDAIGFEMYVKLLEGTVRELKGEEIQDELRATINLKVDLRIDEHYIPDMNQRLTVYRRVAGVRHQTELDEVLTELRDRYGPWPASLLNLAEYGRIRIMADQLGVEAIDREGRTAVIKFRTQAGVDPARLVDAVQRRPDVMLIPPGLLKVDLRADASRPRSAPESWWTVRATTGAVQPGFTRHEIQRPQSDDPRSPDGVFARLADLLTELSDTATIS